MGIKRLLKKSRLITTTYQMMRGIQSNVNQSAFLHGTGGTISSRYCYSVFLRHLAHLHDCGMKEVPLRVAEFGPGDSIGIGLCAVLSGADAYYAMDVVKFANASRNVQMFDELVQLFERREDIPGDAEFPKVKPVLREYAFPSHILTEARLARSLDPERLKSLRGMLANERTEDAAGTLKIEYLAPWFDPSITMPQVDLILSQAVLEHVDDLPTIYRVMTDMLRPSGYMSHEIDFKSHGLTEEWNGHWVYSDAVWRVIRGKRPYLLNRMPLSAHRGMIEAHAFDILEINAEKANALPSIKREKLSKTFRDMSDDDFATSTAYIVARARGAGA